MEVGSVSAAGQPLLIAGKSWQDVGPSYKSTDKVSAVALISGVILFGRIILHVHIGCTLTVIWLSRTCIYSPMLEVTTIPVDTGFQPSSMARMLCRTQPV